MADTYLQAQGSNSKAETVNPVYEWVSRPRGRFDERAAKWIGLIVGGVALGIAILSVALADITQQPVLNIPAAALLGVSLLSTFLIPAIVLVATAVSAYRLLSDQSLALILITPLTADKIVSGLIDGMRYRLRFFWSVGQYLIPAGGVIIAMWIGMVFTGKDYFGGPGHQTYVVFALWGSLPAGIAILLLIWNFHSLFRAALSVGTWLSVRLSQSGESGMSPFGLFASIGVGMLAVFIWVVFIGVVPCLCTTLFTPVIGYFIRDSVQKDAIRRIQNHALLRNSVSG